MFSMFKIWNNANANKWALTRAKGRLNFLVHHGISYALYYFTFVSLGFIASSYSGAIIVGLNTFVILFLTAIIFGGYVANSIWNKTEKDHAKFTSCKKS